MVEVRLHWRKPRPECRSFQAAYRDFKGEKIIGGEQNDDLSIFSALKTTDQLPVNNVLAIKPEKQILRQCLFKAIKGALGKISLTRSVANRHVFTFHKETC
jgi:hypothetical protein